jgi:hypothetical protein
LPKAYCQGLPLQLFGVVVSRIGVLAMLTELYPERLGDRIIIAQHSLLGCIRRVPAPASGPALGGLKVRRRRSAMVDA